MIVLAGVSFEFRGMDTLKAKLLDAAKLKAVERIVLENGVDMQRKAVNNAVFTRGYSTGATKRSISVSSGKLGKFGYRVKPSTEYAAYVELGTRKMSAQPFILPAFQEQREKFKKDMSDLVK